MIIHKEIDLNKPLTAKQVKMLKEMEFRPVQPDEDCPEFTEEQLVRFAEAARERRKRLETKQTVAICLSTQTLNLQENVT